MTFRTTTALGVDISESRISLALLKRGGDGIKLLRAASGPVPEGAIKHGNIEDSALLSRALKELKKRNGIRAGRCAVSLFARPQSVQIMDISGQTPANIRQFVRSELRQCVVLSGKQMASDFCAIGSATDPGSDRVLVAAAEDQKVAEIVKTSNKARLRVEAIEPALLAYARAFREKKLASKFDRNVLLAILRSRELTVCAFSKLSLSFVRTKSIDAEDAQPDGVCHQLVEEINSVVQFYEVEAGDDPGKWDVTVVADDAGQLPDDAEDFLKSRVAGGTLQVRTPQSALQDTPVSAGESNTQQVSIVAVGLAMRLLSAKDESLKINLLPAEVAEVTLLKKHVLITANVAALLVLIMILAVYGLGHLIDVASEKVARKRAAISLHDTGAMIREIGAADGRIKRLSDERKSLKEILDSRHDVDWVALLDDVKQGTPKLLRIKSLISKDTSKMSLEGVAKSYEAVHQFVKMLGKSEHISSASVVQTGRDDKEEAMVRYVISCTLAEREGT